MSTGQNEWCVSFEINLGSGALAYEQEIITHSAYRLATVGLLISIAGHWMGWQALSMTSWGGAPSITIAGAYFPAWLLCAIVAVAVAVIVRILMAATGLSNRIPYQLAVCLSVGAIVALILWQLWAVH